VLDCGSKVHFREFVLKTKFVNHKVACSRVPVLESGWKLIRSMVHMSGAYV
jgi:hypothetical protein